MAQSRIYSGVYANYSDIMYTCGKHLYSGAYTNHSDIVLTTSGGIPIPVLMSILAD